MEVKPKYVISILIILFKIFSATLCAEGGSRVNKYRQKFKNTFQNGVISNKTRQNLPKSNLARSMLKVFGTAPLLKENNIDALLTISLYEADLLKIGASKKLVWLYKKAPNVEEKKKLVDAILKSYVELIKYYGAVNKHLLNRLTLRSGMDYVKQCLKLSENNSDRGVCHKRKALLLVAYLFSHKMHVNFLVRKWLKIAMNDANQLLSNDQELNFMRTRMECEIKLMIQNKSKYSRAMMTIYTGGTTKILTRPTKCINDLMKFTTDSVEAGMNYLEYYYLMGRTYEKDRDLENALKCLHKARKVPVVGEADRYINKRVQNAYEKVYLKLLSNTNYS